jgi:hypothetical protein
MKPILVLIPVLALVGGCVHSSVIAFYEPSGNGTVSTDPQNAPTVIGFLIGEGSKFVLATQREPEELNIIFAAHLTEPAEFVIPSDGLKFSCDGGAGRVRPGEWGEWRLRDGEGYRVERAWHVQLQGRDAEFDKRLPRGDVSSGDYRSTMTIQSCLDSTIVLDLPTVRIAGQSVPLGSVSLTPKQRRFVWAEPQIM